MSAQAEFKSHIDGGKGPSVKRIDRDIVSVVSHAITKGEQSKKNPLTIGYFRINRIKAVSSFYRLITTGSWYK